MLYKWLRHSCLLSMLLLPVAHAQTPPLPIDLIELLGDLDDEDSESLAAALAEVQPEQKNAPSQALPQEIKK